MKVRPIILLALAVLCGGTSALAQEKKDTDITTLLIQDGQVFVNGRAVQVPEMEGEPLEMLGHSYFQATFVGDQPLIFPIGQQWYRFEEDQLVPHVEVSAGRPQEFLSTERISPMRRTEIIYRDAADQYFRDLERQSHRLSLRLSNEQRMEYETRALAAQIRTAQPGELQDELSEQLRTVLGQILDLKQENRMAEIQALEERLGNLKLGLQKRRDMRSELIEARMRELIGTN